MSTELFYPQRTRQLEHNVAMNSTRPDIAYDVALLLAQTLESELADALAEASRLRGALESVSEFQFKVFDSDADEIEATQNIVVEALRT